jgi:tetratricopeptide (TPR) repeat protein
MVRPDGSVKIMDFGIALVTQASTRLTKTGLVPGTLRYMAPEQFNGLDADALGDIFSYGVTYYEFLTGVHPFEAPSQPALMYRVMSVEPDPLRDHLPECPESLQAALARALAKNREQRFQSMEDLQLDMRPIQMEAERALAAELGSQATRLADAGEEDAAYALVRESLTLDPTNAEAVALRRKLQTDTNRQLVRPKVDDLVATGRHRIEQGQFQAAIQTLEAALRLDNSDREIPTLLEEARSGLRKLRQTGEWMVHARQQIQSGNFSEAEASARRVLEGDPTNSDAAALLDTVRHRIASSTSGVNAPPTSGGTALFPAATATMPVATAPPSAKGFPIWMAAAAVGVIAVVAAGLWWSMRPAPAPALGIVEVITEPAGARVRVGGKECVSPDCRLELPWGSHQLQATLDGYGNAEQSLTLDRGSAQPARVTVRLQRDQEQQQEQVQTAPIPAQQAARLPTPAPPAPNASPAAPRQGIVSLSAGAEGAYVFVDNKLYGVTDAQGRLRLNLTPGSHSVRVDKQGFESQPASNDVHVGAGDERELAVQLRRVETPAPAARPAEVAGGPKSAAEPPQWAAAAQEWERVRGSASVARMEEFLKKYPTAPQSTTARQLVDDLRWSEWNKRDVASLKEFATRHPESAHVREAQQMAARLETEARESAAAAQRAAEQQKQAESSRTERNAIYAALARYVAAFEKKDIDALKAAYPEMPAASVEQMKRAFSNRGVRMTMSVQPLSDPEIRGATASMKCQVSTITVANGRSSNSAPKQVTMQLVKRGSEWVIQNLQN